MRARADGARIHRVRASETEWREIYPMDYYAQAGGPWANYPRTKAAQAS